MKILPLALALSALGAHATEIQITAPRFDDGKYVITSASAEGTERTVIIRRTGPYFVTYIKQQFDCSLSTYRQLGTGTTAANIVETGVDEPWSGVSSLDWLFEVKNHVCLSPFEQTAMAHP